MSRRARAYELRNKDAQNFLDAAVDPSKFPVCVCGASYERHSEQATAEFTLPCAETGCKDYRAVTERKLVTQ